MSTEQVPAAHTWDLRSYPLLEGDAVNVLAL